MANEQYLYLQPIVEQHLEIIHSWRTNPKVYGMFMDSQRPSSWEETRKWWNNLPDSVMMMAMLVETTPFPIFWRGRAIGAIWVTPKSEPLLEVIIGEIELFGTPVVPKVYQFAIEAIRKAMSRKPIRTFVKNRELAEELRTKGWGSCGQNNGFSELVYV